MARKTTNARDRWATVAAILDGAFECSADELDAFLDTACHGDHELRLEVEALLRSEMSAPPFLDGDAIQFASPAFAESDELDQEDRRIGSYRLIREVGRGGMGTVYLAERVEGDFQQTVAIKLIRRDLDSEAIERRFRYERQILAHLQHAHIARLYDGGTTTDGVLYFIMEYVEGASITEHCAQRRADLSERLRLFSGACEAVQHAHRSLVVHRDLKPSNILVTPDGQVKLLDFGIAKLLDEGLALGLLPVTRMGLHPMTPEYASPEQLRYEPIAAASDVYSLGMILYELLTGSRPYSIDGCSAAEAERIVSEQIPVRPSQALMARQLGALPSHEDALGTSHLVGRITRDLDAIVLKALKKEPEQRYPSATELLDDLRRYLRGFPVVARDDSTRYRATKFIARNRLAVSVTTLGLLSLLGGLIGTTYQARVAARERDARGHEAQRARDVADFAVGLFDMVDPTNAQGRRVTVQDLVAAGVGRVSRLQGQPRQQAMFMDVMGRVSAAAGQFERADSLLRTAVALKENELGVTDPGIAESLLGLGESLMMQNHLEQAERVLDRAQRLQIAAYGSSDARTLKSQSYLGFVHFTLGNRQRAEELLRAVIAKGAEPELRGRPEILDARYTLARVVDYYGNHAQAEVDIRAELRRQETERGPDHSKTADVALQLGRNLANQGKLDEAAVHYTHVRDVYARVYGGESVFAAMGIYAVAQVHHRRGALRDAEEAYRAAARIYATQPSSRHWHAYARVALGQVLVELKRPRDAERELRHGLRLNSDGTSVDQEQVAVARTWLGRALAEQTRYAEAEPVLVSAYDSLASRSHMARQTSVAARHLVALYRAWNRPDDARRYEAVMSEAERQPAR